MVRDHSRSKCECPEGDSFLIFGFARPWVLRGLPIGLVTDGPHDVSKNHATPDVMPEATRWLWGGWWLDFRDDMAEARNANRLTSFTNTFKYRQTSGLEF